MPAGHITVWVMDFGRKYFVLQWIDPQTGKRKSKSSECTTHKKALIAAAKLEEQLNSLLPKRDGSLLFRLFLELYRTEHLLSLSVGSEKRSYGILCGFKSMMMPGELENTTTLADITSGFLTSYATKLRSSPVRRRAKKTPTPGTSTAKKNSEANIATHMRTIRAALSWAKQNDYIAEVPVVPKQARARRKKAKGRALTLPELMAYLRAIRTHFSKAFVENPRAFIRDYRRLVIGLRRSGLRLEESLVLTWQKDGSHEEAMWIDMSGEFPLLGIVAESEKGKQDRMLPIVPNFARWLMKIPVEERVGFVFKLEKHRNKDERNMRSVSKILSDIGKESGIVVNAAGKYASAHDMRRSFGLEWSRKVYPAELKELMRHKSISTTMDYYVEEEAKTFAARLWAAENADRTTPDTTSAKNAADHKKQKP